MDAIILFTCAILSAGNLTCDTDNRMPQASKVELAKQAASALEDSGYTEVGTVYQVTTQGTYIYAPPVSRGTLENILYQPLPKPIDPILPAPIPLGVPQVNPLHTEEGMR